MKYLLVLVLLLVGCTQTVAPSTSQSAQPTPPSVSPSTPSADPMCSPMGGTPYPCSADEYHKVQEQNGLTEEAIALYRRWTKESTRLYRAGGTTKATQEMLAIMAGDALKSGLGIFSDLKSAGVRASAGQVKVMSIGPDATPIEAGGVAIKACIDGQSLRFVRDGKSIGRGAVAVEQVVAKSVGGRLKMWTVQSEAVDSCQGK